MPIPRTIKIGKLVYAVKEVSADEMARENLWGCVDHASLVIKLRRDLAASVKRETLWHEILHVFESLGVRKFREGELDIMAHTMIGIVDDNKGL